MELLAATAPVQPWQPAREVAVWKQYGGSSAEDIWRVYFVNRRAKYSTEGFSRWKKDAFTCWFLVRNWFTVIIESPAGLLKILVPFQTVSGASGAFPDGSVSQIIWCVRLEKPVDNKHLLSTFIFSCGWSPWQTPPWTQNFVNRISFKNRGQISRR